MDKIGKKSSMPVIMMKVLLVSYIITGILLLILAALLLKLSLTENMVSVGIIAIYIISCFTGGWIMGRAVPAKKYVWGGILGAVYFIILIVVTLLVNHSFQNEAGNMLTTFIICGGSGMVGGMFAK